MNCTQSIHICPLSASCYKPVPTVDLSGQLITDNGSIRILAVGVAVLECACSRSLGSSLKVLGGCLRVAGFFLWLGQVGRSSGSSSSRPPGWRGWPSFLLAAAFDVARPAACLAGADDGFLGDSGFGFTPEIANGMGNSWGSVSIRPSGRGSPAWTSTRNRLVGTLCCDRAALERFRSTANTSSFSD